MNTMRITVKFDDNSKRTYSFKGMTDAEIAPNKVDKKVNEIGDISSWRSLIGLYGGNPSMISEVTTINTQEEVIYNGN